ncbi:hypothetical protein EYF80_049853 [Liparis tanakae]|uniref:Uncharacterized protein n=1 Tax=Liparis tanakae TaxID=230148 RepID=A0A4Z2FFI1_9TELE|nr:hypothetical protein EYF80_049853 [Liparis tanakae]
MAIGKRRGVAGRGGGGGLIWGLRSQSATGRVSGQLVPGAVSVGLTVQGEVGPQLGGVAAQPAVAAAGDQGAPLGLGQRARGVQVLLHGLYAVGRKAGADKALKHAPLGERFSGGERQGWRGGRGGGGGGSQRRPEGDRLIRDLLTGGGSLVGWRVGVGLQSGGLYAGSSTALPSEELPLLLFVMREDSFFVFFFFVSLVIHLGVELAVIWFWSFGAISIGNGRVRNPCRPPVPSRAEKEDGPVKCFGEVERKGEGFGEVEGVGEGFGEAAMSLWSVPLAVAVLEEELCWLC